MIGNVSAAGILDDRSAFSHKNEREAENVHTFFWRTQEIGTERSSGLRPYRSGGRFGQEHGELLIALMQSGTRLRLGRKEFVLGIRN